ncbi:MAG: 1-aminocyclopropane-1-carboxylate deaminase/D-cysteine desulfhydrase [Candidatus Hodarchaeota archaeon]
MLDILPRIRLANLPTPLKPMKNLANSLGLNNLWVKRDDLTGLSFGGNKTRKLEYVVGDAIDKGADTLVTAGAVQSNHCRQTAAIAANVGMRCILLLAGEEPKEYSGNLLLDKLFGAEIQFFPDDRFEDLDSRLNSIMETLEDLGLHPYGMPPGAFMPVGCLGYIQGMVELKEQCDEVGFHPERILVATGTGGTLAGMIIGAKLAGIEADIIGVSVLRDSETVFNRIGEMISRIFDEYPALIDKFEPEIIVDDRFIGEGYGIADNAVKSAIQMFAKMEGILLDPVYTGKAGVALLRMALAGEVSSDTPTLFWHTGGSPALFNLGDAVFED